MVVRTRHVFYLSIRIFNSDVCKSVWCALETHRGVEWYRCYSIGGWWKAKHNSYKSLKLTLSFHTEFSFNLFGNSRSHYVGWRNMETGSGESMENGWCAVIWRGIADEHWTDANRVKSTSTWVCGTCSVSVLLWLRATLVIPSFFLYNFSKHRNRNRNHRTAFVSVCARMNLSPLPIAKYVCITFACCHRFRIKFANFYFYRISRAKWRQDGAEHLSFASFA